MIENNLPDQRTDAEHIEVIDEVMENIRGLIRAAAGQAIMMPNRVKGEKLMLNLRAIATEVNATKETADN